jgi:hypothetical protein
MDFQHAAQIVRECGKMCDGPAAKAVLAEVERLEEALEQAEQKAIDNKARLRDANAEIKRLRLTSLVSLRMFFERQYPSISGHGWLKREQEREKIMEFLLNVGVMIATEIDASGEGNDV